MLEFDMPKEQSSIIKVIGVGGGGSNAVNFMFEQGIRGVNFIIGNTDAQALEMSPIPTKIQLGPGSTEGLGAGSNPEIGKIATQESLEEIRSILEKGTKMVFVTAGMGGGTGTGGAPVVAALARSMGILTVGICTSPFMFEGRRKMQQAEKGIEELRNSVDSLIVISNDKIREIYGNLTRSEAFAKADSILTTAAKSISEIITVAGQINVDFADVEYVMKNSGVSIMGSATAEGEDRAIQAIQAALASPLLNDNDIRGAQKILLNISSGSRQVLIDEITEITEYVQEAAGNETDVIFGTCDDENLGEALSVTVIATGFDKKKNVLSDTQSKVISTPLKRVYNLEENKPAATVEPEVTTSTFEQPIPSVYVEPVAEEEVEERFELTVKPEEPAVSFNFQDSVEEDGPSFIKEEAKEGTITFSLFDAGDVKSEEPVAEREEEPVKEDFSVFMKQEAPVRNEEYTFFNKEEVKAEEPRRVEDDMSAIAQERMRKLRNLSMKLNNPGGLTELEQEPAFKRKNIQMMNAPSSADNNYSRMTFSQEDDKTEVRRNNSFLHDNVD